MKQPQQAAHLCSLQQKMFAFWTNSEVTSTVYLEGLEKNVHRTHKTFSSITLTHQSGSGWQGAHWR